MPTWYCSAAACALAMLMPAQAGLAGCPPDRRAAYTQRVFFGYLCRADCDEEKTGFAWAERRGITDPAACDERPAAFNRGCRAYAEEAVTGEQAGFTWARDNEVTHACRCGGAGQAFEAGCAAYVGSLGQ